MSYAPQVTKSNQFQGCEWDQSVSCSTSSRNYIAVDGDTIRVVSSRTPASATATGQVGEICWDDSYIYICTATNTWKRSAIATW